MSVWREVQETLYRRWRDNWLTTDPSPVALTPFAFGNEKIDPPEALWVQFRVVRLPGGPGTLGRPGNRKMDRAGYVLITVREPPLGGVGNVSDFAERAAKIFENCRIESPHDIRFGQVEPGQEGHIDNGRWWGVSVEGRFDFEDIV